VAKIPSAARSVVDADGGDADALTRPPEGAYDQSPAWAPDGRAIAFQRGDFAFGDIHVLDLESGETTQVTRSRGH
jgi:Tol biopolymer transport system component